MSSARRRSARLIKRPFLFNWTKRAPVYVNLDDEEGDCVEGQDNLKDESKRIDHDFSSKSLDMRSEWRTGNSSKDGDFSDEEDDFVTPAEQFGKTKSVLVPTKRKLKDTVEKQKMTRKKNRKYEGVKKSKLVNVNSEGSRGKSRNQAVMTRGKKIARVGGVKVAISRYPIKLNEGLKGSSPIKKQETKKVRSYEGYLQKKFSPSIMTDVFINLSEAQAEWVRSTGFGDLINFRMVSYPHKLGYNLVEAFSVEKSALILTCGTIEINDKVVNRVMGLPMGDLELTITGDESESSFWGGQFKGKAGCSIPPLMVRDRVLKSRVADKNFKLNFLVLLYNFFIEGNQNRFLNRDVLKIKLDLDACRQYNWCRLLLDKLKKSHDFWVGAKTRYFTGSLSFLIYLYLSKVRNDNYVHVPHLLPAFRGWSDMLIRERQKKEEAEGSFGLGVIVKFLELDEDGSLLVEKAEDQIMMQATELHNEFVQIGDKQKEENTAESEDDVQVNEIDFEQQESVYEAIMKDAAVKMEFMPNVQDIIKNIKASIEADKNVESIDEKIVDIVTDNIQTVQMNEKDAFLEKRAEANDSTSLLLSKETISRTNINIVNEHTTYLTKRLLGNNKGNEKSGEFTQEMMSKGVMQTPMNETLKKTASKVEAFGIDGTQETNEDVIDNHFREDKYIEEFSRNLEDFNTAYEKCVNNFEVAYALFPNNEKLAELRVQHRQFFKLFEDTSPLTKKLLRGIVPDKTVAQTTDLKETSYMPSFSLGLTQMTPNNLGESLDRTENAKEAPVEVGTRLVCRPRRGVRATEICRSPFVSRILDITGHKITAEEKLVWDWLFENKRNKREHLFEWNSRMCTKAHFQSLQENKLVESTVIDTWSYLLNANELLRSNTSPFRLFMTSETTYGPMNLVEDVDDPLWKLKRNAIFDDNMDVVMETERILHNRIYDVKDFDMFVFPIFESSHHYIVSYNVRKPTWDIIDNRAQIADFEEMYGDLPYRLHTCFCDWISIYHLPKEKEIMNLAPRVVRVGWETKENSVDCGVFTMRHMETYMGNLYRWRTGLRPESDNQKSLLNKLRMVYAHKILTWEHNTKKDVILSEAAYLAKGKRVAG